MPASKPCIVISGNPVEGFKFYGPFPCAAAALEWIEVHCVDHECWIAELQQEMAL